MKKEKKIVRVTICMSPELAKMIRDISEEENRSISSYIRFVLEKTIERRELWKTK